MVRIVADERGVGCLIEVENIRVHGPTSPSPITVRDDTPDL